MRVALGLIFALSAAACGDDGINHIPDPPPPDGRPDANDAPVTLTITDGAMPQPGIVVLFQNADSTLVTRAMTDVSGVASARMAAGGFVTAVNPFGLHNPTAVNGAELRTFAGVKPGDQLRLHRPADEQMEISVTLVVPIDPLATSYQLLTNCGGQDITGGSGSGSGSGTSTPGGTVSLYGCGPTIDLVIETRDGNFEPLNALVRRDVPISNGAMIDLTADTYAETPAVTFGYQNVAAAVTTLNVSRTLATAKGVLHSVSGGADLTAGAVSLTLRQPVVANATGITTTEFYSGGFGRHTVVDWGAPGNYAFDGASAFLREYATAPVFDHHAHKLTWTSSGGAAPDAAVAHAYFQRPNGKGSDYWNWRIAGPYDSDALLFPVLPSTESELNPGANDDFSLDEFYTLKAPGGYDAVRPDAHSTEPPKATGASGRILIEELDGGGVAALRQGRRVGGAKMYSRPLKRR